MNEIQRSEMREKILSYPYSKQVDILNYIIHDSLLCERDGVLNYYTDEVLTSIISAIAKPLKNQGYKLRCYINGNSGSLCEWASLSGALCCAVENFIANGCSEIAFDIKLDKSVQIQMTSDCCSIDKSCVEILKNTARIHGGRCFCIKSDLCGVSLVFPFVKGSTALKPPSPDVLIGDKYSVVRIILHNLF